MSAIIVWLNLSAHADVPVTTLLSFSGANGANPNGLVLGNDGNFYGTTYGGGARSNFGTVFKVTPNGTVTILASLASTNGAYPTAPLLLASDGNFYGTTSAGGGKGFGVVFEVTNNGTGTISSNVTLRASFNGVAGNSYSSLVQDASGYLYGTSSVGGAYGYGTIFKVPATGTQSNVPTTLVSFNNTNGAYPYAALVQGNDSNFYGTTYGGGASANFGTVFKVTPNGTVTILASLAGNNGAYPAAPLLLASDGNFYGTTAGGGTNGSHGTVFRITTNGTLSSLASFSGTNGANPGADPAAGLIQGADGNFYGTTYGGGTFNGGTVFEITSSGVLATLASLNTVTGANPGAGLVFGTDGNLYGTATTGGTSGNGTIFRLMPPPSIVVQPQSQTNYVGSNVRLFVQATAAAPLAYQWQFDGTAIAGATNSSFTISNLVLTNQGAYSVLVSDFAGTVTSATVNVTVVVVQQPSIPVQPSAQSVPAGANAIFSVTATGAWLAYQWYQATTNSTNALSDGGQFSGSATSKLAISAAQAADQASYWVVVSNAAGAVTSSIATLTLNPVGPPSYVTTEPATLVSSTSAILNGVATENQLSLSAWFQWGTNTGYANQTSATNLATAGKLTWVSNLITGLNAGQVYHFRLVASNAQSVVCGADQVFSLSRKVWAWGDDALGQIDVPPAVSNVVAIAGGEYFSLALQAGGTVTAWGQIAGGQTNVPSGWTNCVAIAAGYQHALALRNDGTVAAWGANTYGQTDVPAASTNVVALAAGDAYSLALRNDGTVIAWGDDSFGQTSGASGLGNVVAIAAGGAHGLALTNDGSVIAWGDNSYGQSVVPLGLTNVVAIAAGLYHSLALSNNGTVAAWGDNTYGQTDVPALATNVIAIAAGRLHSLALLSDGSVLAWGYDANNQTAMQAGLANAFAIAAGAYHSLALTADQAPVASSQTIIATNGNNPIMLSASSATGTNVYYIITSLPSAGTLYQYNSGSAGAAISASNTVVSDTNGHVIFAPQAGTYSASFQFIASDGTYPSAAATVTISVVGLPSVITNSGVEVSATYTLLSAVVLPNSLPTVAWFQYGLTNGLSTNYGMATTMTNLGNGTSSVAFSQTVGGLLAQSFYHGQTVASNGLGVTYGNDFVFVTTVGPLLTNLALRTSGAFHFGFTGTPMALYTVLASTNLLTWTNLGVATEDVPGVFEFNDPAASNPTNLPQRYYRLRWP